VTARATDHFHAVVVGSGFGGSVMAWRLAEAGRSVCLLERGRAYPPGSFARSPNEMRTNFWDPGRDLYGLFDLWSFRNLESVVSSGLGGGSLIYANVLLRKDERWFVTDDPAGYEHWPVTRADLEPHYDAVEEVLRPQRYPVEHSPYRETPKTLAYARAAERLGLDHRYPPLAVRFANDGRPPAPGERLLEDHGNLHGAERFTCRLVGECDVGCNWGAKETLDFNYLSMAKRAGADIRTGADARELAPRAGGGYRVGYVRHPDGSRGEVTADRLILAAGTLGSSWLLLRNRRSFPALSRRLGSRFCGNGDLLTFAVKCREPIEPSRGPVITSAIRYEGDGRGFYVEDAGLPEFATWMVQTTDAPNALRRAASVLWQMLRQRVTGDPQSNMSAEASALLGDDRPAAAFLPLLGMGRDIPNGNMTLTRSGYLDIDWREEKSGPYFDRVRAEMQRIADALGAECLVDNPIWHLNRRLITVHPLGGCPMGRSAQEGVVDSYGQAFGHPGVYVADGAVMPGPVGPNPSLTIAALADRFATAILEDRPGESIDHAPAVAVPARSPVAVSFTEEMKGFVAEGETDHDRGFRTGRAAGTPLMFHLTITADDLDDFVADRDHQARATGWVEGPSVGGRRPVEAGLFNLFVDEDDERTRKRMRYLLPFRDAAGAPRTLRGHKVVEDDPGFDSWRDTTTLYTSVLDGHAAGWDDDLPVLAAGILHIHLRDFARQLTTFRSDPPGRTAAIARFGQLFAGELWDVYGG
jgi:cholesterol oxidase